MIQNTIINVSDDFIVGMVSKPTQESTAGFQILQEDFPALPGAQSKYISIVIQI